jgi:hypothetical protein
MVINGKRGVGRGVGRGRGAEGGVGERSKDESKLADR